ncbi:RAMP superfamily CRISPR-associated protein [Crenalkalicoccus roseus]|uniref:RAMP superfamily CRISPR-associated protein n=1 Tax=Crenalkalicoccus roseus TaxID=1485588 RepID=UPI001080016A|nr:RAMP superfamily CRISPR-associated protein [Crenalkalicoccus roseus]
MNLHAGPPRAMARLTLRLVPLTPLHIGDGTEMRLDEYVLDEPSQGQRFDKWGEEIEEQAQAPKLCRFDQAKAMRAMTPAQRSAFQHALDSGQLGEAARALREAGRGAIVERMPISRRSAAELKKAFKDPLLRSGQVKPFIRSGGRLYIPGSSLKGAFRTALASAALPRDCEPPGGWHDESALSAALGLSSNDTTTDPLRFLHVEDAFLPEDATLIDQAEVMHLKNPAAGKAQMHYERTRALTDGAKAPVFTVAIHLDGRALDGRCVARQPARFDLRLLLSRCRAFHLSLFNTEMARFFEGAVKARLLRLLRGHAGEGGRLPVTQQGWSPGFVLLRLGRFGHFESKSLEGVRRGHVPQATHPADRIRPPGAWGQTRTVTRDAAGNPIPFGWVIGWAVASPSGRDRSPASQDKEEHG